MRRLLFLVFSITLVLSLSRAESDHIDLIVTLKNGQNIRSVSNENHTHTIGQVANTPVYLVRLDGDDREKAIKDIRKNGAVESVEPNISIRLTATDAPLTANINLGHALSDLLDGETRTTFYGTDVLKSYVAQPALDLIKVSGVRDLSTGAATRVAYIDTGVDPDHPALKPWLDPGFDLLQGNSVSEMDGLDHAMSDLLDHAMSDLLDTRFYFILNQSLGSLLNGATGSNAVLPAAFGHGTIVAGLIHVVAPQARIIPIKAFDPYGNTTMFTIVEGVYRAIEANADVLNMSFSTETDSQALHKALDKAKAAGIGLVAAVGNEGRDSRELYPAAYGTVYGVAATDLEDHLATFSNYGRNITVTAPGAFVISTAPGGHYAIAWGTSFSSPIVAGSIALLASDRPQGQSDQNLVINTADPIDAMNPGFERKLGKGRINLEQAFRVKR